MIVGDVVRLNSGGPKMVVIDVDKEGKTVGCCYIKKQWMHRHILPLYAVHKVGFKRDFVTVGVLGITILCIGILLGYVVQIGI